MGHGIRGLAEVRALTARLTLLATDEDGMSTAEYAIGTIRCHLDSASHTFVVTGDSIVTALTNIIDKALNTAV